jgi:subtilisin family serine protease
MRQAGRSDELTGRFIRQCPHDQSIQPRRSEDRFDRTWGPILCVPVMAMLNVAWSADAFAVEDPIDTQSITIESLQQTVQERQAQSRMTLQPDQAAESSATGSTDTSAPAQPVKPPGRAAAHERGMEASSVKAQAGHAAAAKRAPDRAPDAGSTPQVVPPATGPSARQISFAAASFTPERGIGERLLRATETAQGRQETYAFLLLNEAPTPEVERELQAAGVTFLGQHDDAFKVRVPLRRDALEAIATKPYVHSLSYAFPEQKFAADLDRSVAAFANEISQFPIIVNLFEDDPRGAFADRIRSLGVDVGSYDKSLKAYTALASAEQIRALADLDFVLFVEIERRSQGGHDQSMPTNSVDYIRASGFNGAPITLGILDTGFMLGTGAPTMHQDLNKNGCGKNFTTDSANVWNDQNSHGTHVLGTITGTGTANSRYRGVATALGTQTRIRAAKIWTSAGSGQSAWMRSAMDYMGEATSCDAPRPQAINISGGASGTGQTGTDTESRKLDSKVWELRQAYIVCSGNSGPGSQTIWSPGVAKNALTVGNVQDNTYLQVGELWNSSSLGPTGDGRMKPNLVATGAAVTSALAGTTNQYTTKTGCSMATPHVSGIATSLMEHYPEFRDRPQLLRAHLMASTVLHHDETTPANNTNGGRNDYGLGRISDYEAHWAHFNSNGWRGRWTWQTITNSNWGFFDVDVPQGTDRLIAVMTWDEPEASAGASRAVTYDLDLWVDYNVDCTPDAKGQCGEWASQSSIDNTEYVVINNPPAGKYRFKMVNWNAPSFGVPAAIAVKVIEGDPTPLMNLAATPSTSTPAVGSTCTVTTTVQDPAYEAYGVHVSVPEISSGLTLLGASTTREDGVAMNFANARGLTLGSILEGDSRSAVWQFRVDTPGAKTMKFQAWSDNGGTRSQVVTVGQTVTAAP